MHDLLSYKDETEYTQADLEKMEKEGESVKNMMGITKESETRRAAEEAANTERTNEAVRKMVGGQ